MNGRELGMSGRELGMSGRELGSIFLLSPTKDKAIKEINQLRGALDACRLKPGDSARPAPQ
jgi:hypothetical protein